MEMTLGELAAQLGGTLIGGDTDCRITGIAGFDTVGPSEVTYITSVRNLAAAEASPAAAILAPVGITGDAGKPRVLVADPRMAFAQVLRLFDWRTSPIPGIASTACVAASASVHAKAHIAPLAVIGEGAVIGSGCAIHAHAVIGDHVVVGADTVIHPQVTIYPRCTIGSRVIIHAGAVIGADGLGFQPSSSGWEKIPHTGTVIIEDDVEIGANVTIDRATTGMTVVGAGTKIDNLVQIGHNVKIGPHCMIVAMVGIAGSAQVDGEVIIAGQSGIGDHVHIGKGAHIGYASGVSKPVPAGETVSGYPAQPHREELRYQAALRRVPDLLLRVKELERRLQEASGE